MYMYMYTCTNVHIHTPLIADSFHYLRNEDRNESIDLSRNDIAWDTDRDVRFRNPSNFNRSLTDTNMPPNWPYYLSGTIHYIHVLYTHVCLCAILTFGPISHMHVQVHVQCTFVHGVFWFTS